MTEIPGGFPKKVCPETFVSNHTGPIRLAEDQMQQLLECIHGVNLRSEPKPKPGQVKVSGEGWVGPYDKDDYIRTLEAQIKCLQSNLDAANDRAHKAARDVERLKQCVEDSDNNATYWRGLVELCTVEKIQKLKKELADQVDLGSHLWLDNKDLLKENEDLKAQIADYQKQHEMTMGVGDGDGNLFVHGSQEAIHRVREYLSAIEQLVKEKHELKAQVPKERLKVDVWYHVATGYSLHLLELKSLLICNLASREEAIQWAEDHGLEVVE